jgi:hypothetical protein
MLSRSPARDVARREDPHGHSDWLFKGGNAGIRGKRYDGIRPAPKALKPPFSRQPREDEIGCLARRGNIEVGRRDDRAFQSRQLRQRSTFEISEAAVAIV